MEGESNAQKDEKKKGPSREEKKAQRLAEREKKSQESKSKKDEEETETFTNFGKKPLIQSQTREGRQWTKIRDLDESKASQKVLVRGRIHTSRASGANLCFLVLREKGFTIQAVVAKGKEVPKPMVAFVANVPKESIVDVEGVITVPKEKVTSTTQQSVELQVHSFFVISEAETLPLQIEDAARPKAVLKEQKKVVKDIEQQIAAVQAKLAEEKDEKAHSKLKEELEELEKRKSAAQKYPHVKRETRLNNRVVELRTPANAAIFKIQSAVCTLFREYLLKNDFMEIHSPKIIYAASEGGAEVFKVQYFDRSAYLAQSPQFYKQMVICSDFERVFEIGPVFRAENSFTHRHMTEFMGLDLEMTFKEHYHEVLDVLDGLFTHMFDGLANTYARELEIVNQQYSFEPLKYLKPSLRLKFADAVAMLKADGVTMDDYEDLNTAKEKHLGRLVKEKYNTDFFILDRFPLAVRPFYTMPAPDDLKYSNSYDFFLRGEEIMSGAQRVHDPKLLVERLNALKIKPSSVQDYIDSFKYGAPPHGGGGIGLERVVMLYLGLKNIRMSSLFPRDPKRLTP